MTTAARVPLGDLARVDTGTQLNRTLLRSDATYPVFNGGVAASGYHSAYNTPSRTIAVSQGGASAGFVNFVETDFWAGAHCYTVIPTSDAIRNKFLYYVLKQRQGELQQAKVGAGIPGLNRGVLKNLPIPIPTRAVQDEIVRILDSFTELEAELEAELETRRRQYAHYRHTLLTFSTDSVPKVALGDVVAVLDSKRRPIKKADRKPGPYPYYGANGIQDWVSDFLFDGAHLLMGEDGSVVNTDGSPVVNWAEGRIWVNNHAHVLAEHPGGVNLRFIYHFLRIADVTAVAHGVPPKITQADLRAIPIPVPPLDEQQRIVEILDKFDALVNDLSIGLPAELAARRKQYEYYRDRLLTFEEAA